ncbi:hypothetical protein HGB13_01435 [bacterium]|nr:hypothetical protein [bacterium]
MKLSNRQKALIILVLIIILTSTFAYKKFSSSNKQIVSNSINQCGINTSSGEIINDTVINNDNPKNENEALFIGCNGFI